MIFGRLFPMSFDLDLSKAMDHLQNKTLNIRFYTFECKQKVLIALFKIKIKCNLH